MCDCACGCVFGNGRWPTKRYTPGAYTLNPKEQRKRKTANCKMETNTNTGT
jgi:hypothetical protein